MIIDQTTANRFIDTYMDFLETLVSDEEKRSTPILEMLAIGRGRYAADRNQLNVYRSAHPEADAEMLDAIAAIRIGCWAYLKDTRSYSVLLLECDTTAYAVLGLTDPLRTMAQGCNGLMMETGVLPLNGRWVCDGLFKNPMWIGPNMRRDLNAEYQTMRKKGRFSFRPAGSACSATGML
ncbi:hypothetical protein ACVBEF_03600 [Glaciimonas sp. GG7]